MKKELIITDDGSHTIYLPELDECYHSKFGALSESLHIFMKNGYKYCKKKEINILEIGFGTGLNAYLTYLESKKDNKIIFYHSIEKYPLENDIISLLNYTELINKEEKIFYTLHSIEWNNQNLWSG